MIRILFALFFFITATAIKAQTLIIDSLVVSKVITSKNKEDLFEHEGKGPLVNFFITIKNDADSTIVLNTSESDFGIRYRYNNCDYSALIACFSLIPFAELNNLSLKKNEEFSLAFSDRIFLGTDILDHKTKKVYDYSKEILQALPTLQLIYKDPKLRMVSTRIRSVKLFDYEYTYE